MIEKKKYHSTHVEPEKAILVGLVTARQSSEKLEEYMEELAFLAETAGANAVKRFSQKLDKPHSGTFVGKGKLEEIARAVVAEEADVVIFDDELSPSQIRNLEREFNKDPEMPVKVLDRTSLILDIFAQRATTSYARTQVELAQYKYLLPRLTGMWTHLERQKGGIGLRGPGESQIESDRRVMRDKISLLKKKLASVDKQMELQRSNRGAMVRVSLVGYTNVGKSTIMTALSKSEVFAENKLFATLDTTVRKIVLQNIPFLLSDTVGFIRKLPHELVESFKSTLDEVRESDLLLHVVDISHPSFEDHYNVVNQTLQEIGAADKPTLVIFNKIDAYTHIEKEEIEYFDENQNSQPTLQELQNSWMAKTTPNTCLFISAINKDNFDELREVLYEEVKKIHSVRFPFNNYLY